MIKTLNNDNPSNSSLHIQESHTGLDIKRKFIIGDEWLTYKLYMGTQTADNFLKDQLKVAVETLKKLKLIEKWFFIRYADPYNHLRIRFQVKNKSNLGKVIEIIYKNINPLVEQRFINKVVVDTYSRELERYGRNTIEESEKLFQLNSEIIINLLSQIDEDENQRWLLGLKGIDNLLEGFGYKLIQKRDLLFELREDFAREFGVQKYIKKQLSQKFRENREMITNILTIDSLYFKDSIKNYSEVCEKIYDKNIFFENKVELGELLYSYIHMHCNRLFTSKHRKNEWVLYEMLYLYYYSDYARKKSQSDI